MSGATNHKGGRKSDKKWRDALMRAMARQADCVDAGFDKLADVVVAQAMGGEKEAWKEIGDRIDGKPKQQTELSGPEGEAIPVGIRVSFTGRKPAERS